MPAWFLTALVRGGVEHALALFGAVFLLHVGLDFLAVAVKVLIYRHVSNPASGRPWSLA